MPLGVHFVAAPGPGGRTKTIIMKTCTICCVEKVWEEHFSKSMQIRAKVQPVVCRSWSNPNCSKTDCPRCQTCRSPTCAKKNKCKAPIVDPPSPNMGTKLSSWGQILRMLVVQCSFSFSPPWVLYLYPKTPNPKQLFRNKCPSLCPIWCPEAPQMVPKRPQNIPKWSPKRPT